MIDFLHTYGAFMLMVLVLLSPIMLLVFCRTFLRPSSEPDHAAPGGRAIVGRREPMRGGQVRRDVPVDTQKAAHEDRTAKGHSRDRALDFGT